MSEPRQLTGAQWRNEMYGTWIDEIADFTEADQARIIERINGNVETREVRPGVWEHTFTPRQMGLFGSYQDFMNTPVDVIDEMLSLEQMHDHEPYMPYPMSELADASIFCMTRNMAHRIRVLSAKAQRYVRSSKRAKRQRRAAQRRHNRGLR